MSCVCKWRSVRVVVRDAWVFTLKSGLGGNATLSAELAMHGVRVGVLPLAVLPVVWGVLAIM